MRLPQGVHGRDERFQRELQRRARVTNLEFLQDRGVEDTQETDLLVVGSVKDGFDFSLDGVDVVGGGGLWWGAVVDGRCSPREEGWV